MIHVYCGLGKGKTTAAMGLALRAAGAGRAVRVVQFLKDGSSSEVAPLRSLGVRVVAGKTSEKFSFAMNAEELAATRALHDAELEEGLCAVRAGECDVLVLDEALGALGAGLLSEGLVREALALAQASEGMGEGRQNASAPAACASGWDSAAERGKVASSVELVLTGRAAPDFVREAADYLTEMRCARHPYDKGIAARKGIEY